VSHQKTYVHSCAFTVSLFIFLIMILQTIYFPMAYSSNSVPSVFSPDSRPYGLTYPQWTAKWWQWFISIPNDNNHPLNDATGASCAVGQAGPVWFLAGSATGHGVRTCTVPHGKAILFPTINNECSTAEDPSLKTESDLRNCAVSNASYFRNFEVTVDGVPLNNMEKYNVQSTLFNVIFPDHPIFTAHAGPSQSVSAGNWVFLSPLSPGTHEIHFKGASVDFTGVATHNFAQDVTYNLLVQ
jgi:hypothetical protein